jgi:hypothetical protein
MLPIATMVMIIMAWNLVNPDFDNRKRTVTIPFRIARAITV